jgi:hypothetical protein
VRFQPAGHLLLGASTYVRTLSPYFPSTPCLHTGLAKAEDKARVHRSKKQEGPVPEDVRKKVLATTTTVCKEVVNPAAYPAPGGSSLVGPIAGLCGGLDLIAQAWGLTVLPGCCTWCPGHPESPQAPEALPCLTGGPEEQWQRAIHERGEAICPTCNVVTRKTLVGLKKHMEVCQKVRLSQEEYLA